MLILAKFQLHSLASQSQKEWGLANGHNIKGMHFSHENKLWKNTWVYRELDKEP